MMLRSVSIIATAVLTGTAIALVYRGAIFGTGPISISLQLLGLALVLWPDLLLACGASITPPIQHRADL